MNKKQGELPYNLLISEYKYRIQGKGLEWALTDETAKILFNGTCFYCGAPPSNVFRKKRARAKQDLIYNGIDRVDNTKGYTEENSVTCCKLCNQAKSNLTIEDFEHWSSLFALKFLGNHNIEIFSLYRKEDVSKVSGKGAIALIIKFPSGKCIMEWLGQYKTTTFFDNIQDIEAIHGHENKTIIVKGFPKKHNEGEEKKNGNGK